MDTSRISVIVPALDEAEGIGEVVERALEGGACEVVVADGGSADETVARARAAGARVLDAGPPCRGAQLNRGARAASGDIFLFLHADTRLPRGWREVVEAALADEHCVAAAFRLRIDAAGAGLRVVERLVAWRSRWLRLPYGDQALALRARTFRRVGGYRNWPAMEDYDLVRRLRKFGRVALVEPAVVTSARRWLRDGIWRTGARNLACVAAWHAGVSPWRIAGWRGRDRAPVRPGGNIPAASAAHREILPP